MALRTVRRYRVTGVVTRPRESDIQKAVFDWIRTQQVPNIGGVTRYMVPLLHYVFAIPNGQMLAGNAAQRARYMRALKDRGLKPGVSDIMIAYPCGKYHGAFVELKRDAKAVVSSDQLSFQGEMRAAGYWCKITCGYDDTVSAIREYICAN